MHSQIIADLYHIFEFIRDLKLQKNNIDLAATRKKITTKLKKLRIFSEEKLYFLFIFKYCFYILSKLNENFKYFYFKMLCDLMKLSYENKDFELAELSRKKIKEFQKNNAAILSKFWKSGKYKIIEAKLFHKMGKFKRAINSLWKINSIEFKSHETEVEANLKLFKFPLLLKLF